MPKANERSLTAQSEDFSAWYNEVVRRAELADHGPVRGTMIIRPYGYRLWELLQADLDQRIKATGHENAYFPIFIPEGHLRREAEHVEGFAPELAVVTHAGGKALDEALVVRPTSETLIGEAFSRWIDSYRDLPLLINQWANVVRWELRPRLFLRTTEFLWQEGHTAHADQPDALRETMTALSFYEALSKDVAAMPVVAGEKTKSERFAGAERTFTIEGLMRDGRALQAGTSHYLGTNFARAFDITFASSTGSVEHCHTTSWGMSTRMIGGLIMTHGDDRGLILPPRLAPFQVVVIPIGRSTDFEPVREAAKDFSSALEALGVRVRLDDRVELSPGFKFNEWELRGVPLRVEIGPRDLAAGVVTLSDRLTGEKSQIALAQSVTEMPARLQAFQDALLARATAFRDEHTHVVNSYEELKQAVADGFASALLCEDEACEARIKADTSASARCIPLSEDEERGPCVVCGKPSSYPKRLLFARAY